MAKRSSTGLKLPNLNLNNEPAPTMSSRRRRSNNTRKTNPNLRPDSAPAFTTNVVCGDLTFEGGVVKHYTSAELNELISDIKFAANTRKFWVREGSDKKKATLFTNKGLLKNIEDETGKEFRSAKEAAAAFGYVIVTVQVGADRLPIIDDEGNVTIIDTDPAYDGEADDA